MEFNRKAPLGVKMLLQIHLVLIETHRVRFSLLQYQPREKLYIRSGGRNTAWILVQELAWEMEEKRNPETNVLFRPQLAWSGQEFLWKQSPPMRFQLQWNLISPCSSDVILKKKLAPFSAISGYWPICLLRAMFYFSDKHPAGCFYAINWHDDLHRNVPASQGLPESQTWAKPQHFCYSVLQAVNTWGFWNVIKTISEN